MAEPITIAQLVDASEDAQTLALFANADAATQVPRRLADPIETLDYWRDYMASLAKGADGIQGEQGVPGADGLDGSYRLQSYLTYDDMVADVANIPANTSVRVTNDSDSDKNGDYTYDGTTFTKSPYDPLTQAKAYTDTAKTSTLAYVNTLPAIFTAEWQQINFEIINDYIINETVTNPLLTALTGGQYIRMGVQNVSQLRIKGSRNEPTWALHFTDASGVRLPKASYGNGTFAVPAGAVYAYRTFINSSKQEFYFMYVEGYTSGISKADINASDINAVNNKLSNFIDTTKSEVITQVMPIEPIASYYINKDVGANSVASYRAEASFLMYDVSGVDTVTIANGLPSFSNFPWVFLAADHGLVQITAYNTDGTFSIPDGVRYIVKTYKLGSTTEPETLSITFKYKQDINIKDVVTTINTEADAADNIKQIAEMVEKLETAWEAGNTLKISSFVGDTQHEQIDNAIAFIKSRGWGILDMESGLWLRDSAILLPSNCWIYLNTAEIKLADGVYDNIMRNDGIVPNPDPFEPALELNENSNIRIFGASNTTSFVSGPTTPYTAPHPIDGGDPIPWTGDFYGWRTLGILLANVKSYKLHDFGMRSTVCWAISQEHGCDDFEVYNLDFFTAVKNGDGVDIRQGCSNGKIYNITGRTSDDAVAMTALGGFIAQHPSGNYIYPLQVGGYADRGFGTDITDMSVSNIITSGQHHGVRLLCSSGSEMHRITVDKVEDTTGSSWIASVVIGTTSGNHAPYGAMTDIFVNNIKSNYADTTLKLSAKLENCAFNDIKQANASGDIYTSAFTLNNSPITNARRV